MSPFYSGKGDNGLTDSLGEKLVSKASHILEVVGTLDEASALMGLARSLSALENSQKIIVEIQKQIYRLMAEISRLPLGSEGQSVITSNDLSWIEEKINQFENAVKMPDGFILPGGSPASAALAVARTVVRRAERRTVSLFHSREIHKPDILAYLNRLSSLIFILEIFETTKAGGDMRMSREG